MYYVPCTNCGSDTLEEELAESVTNIVDSDLRFRLCSACWEEEDDYLTSGGPLLSLFAKYKNKVSLRNDDFWDGQLKTFAVFEAKNPNEPELHEICRVFTCKDKSSYRRWEKTLSAKNKNSDFAYTIRPVNISMGLPIGDL